MKNFNAKSKSEQVFLMMLLSVGCLCAVILTGCGGKSCETIKCNSVNEDGLVITGISVPGCGGCLTSGEGCNSCLWAQSYKCVAGSESEEVEEEDGNTSTDRMRVIGCDARYYGGGCAGCEQKQKSSYVGCVNQKDSAGKTSGCFYGSSDKEEKLIGCRKGSGGCAGSDGLGRLGLDIMEEGTKIE
ncbi:MAG: hypothetical protein NC302_02900 [Bacteroidales bacterium]|nr:hypothetical protein [Bacteroidales bacterium]MCM1414604.1 hypothetical protein [bacterium]MCM1423966.1 hypothetical protein [bacterium]